MRKIVLTFGLIAGAILSAMMLITLPFHDVIGYDNSLVVGYTSIVVAFLLIFFMAGAPVVGRWDDRIGGRWGGRVARKDDFRGAARESLVQAMSRAAFARCTASVRRRAPSLPSSRLA